MKNCPSNGRRNQCFILTHQRQCSHKSFPNTVFWGFYLFDGKVVWALPRRCFLHPYCASRVFVEQLTFETIVEMSILSTSFLWWSDEIVVPMNEEWSVTWVLVWISSRIEDCSMDQLLQTICLLLLLEKTTWDFRVWGKILMYQALYRKYEIKTSPS